MSQEIKNPQIQRDNNFSEKRIVAFLDILGFKNLIEKNDSQKENEVLDFLYEIKKIPNIYDFNLQSKPDNPGWGTIEITPEFSSASDHMIISVPIRPGKILPFHHQFLSAALNGMGHLINTLHIKSLKLGIALRGAISYGDQYYDRDCNINVGKPLIEAVNNESKLAIFPRVIVSKSLLNELETNCKLADFSGNEFQTKFLASHLRRDFDGMYFFDYLHALFFKATLYDSELKLLKEIRDQIATNIRSCSNGLDMSISIKWFWLANYFDIKLKSFKKNPRLLEIEGFDLLASNFENMHEAAAAKQREFMQEE